MPLTDVAAKVIESPCSDMLLISLPEIRGLAAINLEHTKQRTAREYRSAALPVKVVRFVNTLIVLSPVSDSDDIIADVYPAGRVVCNSRLTSVNETSDIMPSDTSGCTECVGLFDPGSKDLVGSTVYRADVGDLAVFAENNSQVLANYQRDIVPCWVNWRY